MKEVSHKQDLRALLDVSLQYPPPTVPCFHSFSWHARLSILPPITNPVPFFPCSSDLPPTPFPPLASIDNLGEEIKELVQILSL